MKQKPTKKCENGVQLRPASIEEAGLFYSELDEKQDEALGTVGHIRMDFGSGGKEFWHTWWPHNEDRFNTLEFKEELQAIVDTLRANGPLKDLASMSNYCHKNGGAITEDSRSFGYGTKYCHKSPTLEEGSLQRTILAAISSVMSQKETIISRITGAMEQTLAPIPGETMSLSEIEQRLAEIDEEVRRIVVQTAEQGLNICSDHMKALTDECAELKKQRSRIQEQRTNNSALMKRVDDVASTLRQTSPTITEWDESIIRQLVDTVKVVSSEKIIVYL